MQFSDKGISLLKTLEGFRGKPYPDSGGKMTVGYGHLIIPGDGVVGDRRGAGITFDAAAAVGCAVPADRVVGDRRG